jgi:hypothetical protein
MKMQMKENFRIQSETDNKLDSRRRMEALVGTLEIIKGDATLPKFTTTDTLNETRIIIHICNDINRWGKGFVLPLGDRYPSAKAIYHKSASQAGYHELGSISHSTINPSLAVINMVAQRGISKDRITGEPPIRYDALRQCLQKIRELVTLDFPTRTISFHMPRIGCGLAGGEWTIVSEIITAELVTYGFQCVVYNL